MSEAVKYGYGYGMQPGEAPSHTDFLEFHRGGGAGRLRFLLAGRPHRLSRQFSRKPRRSRRRCGQNRAHCARKPRLSPALEAPRHRGEGGGHGGLPERGRSLHLRRGGRRRGGEASSRCAAFPSTDRGARTDEAIAVLRKLWSGEAVSHKGRFFRFPDARQSPPPLARPGGPPIWVGGRSEAAQRRAALLADGYAPYLYLSRALRGGAWSADPPFGRRGGTRDR